MSKTDSAIYKYLGQKFFKVQEDDSVNMVRVIKILPFNDKVIIKDEFNPDKTSTVTIEKLRGYTPLESYGIITTSIVKMGEHDRDVIISLFRLLDLKMDIKVPYAICRQNVLDFFYTLINPEAGINDYVGISCNRDDCPTNIKYEELMACSGLIKNDAINIYYNDTIDTILECLDEKEYDKVLMSEFRKHADHINNPFIVDNAEVKSHAGWCKTLRQLLEENNFQNDFDNLFNIVSIVGDIEANCTMGEDEVLHFNPDLRNYFCYIEKIPAVDIVAIPYWHDIDMADFNNKNYIFVRDNTKLYICCYVCQGEYLEEDLFKEMNKETVLEKYALNKYDKFLKKKV